MRVLGAALAPVVKAGDRYPVLASAAYRVLRTLNIHPGVERWPVKTLADTDAIQIHHSPTPTTVAELVALPNPQPSGRLAPTETTVYQLEATLTAFKLETDGDYHLAIEDGTETMIAEIPDPDFLTPATGTQWATAIRRARSDFDAWAEAPVGDRYQTCAQKINLTGVGFFDFNHGQRGVAPNAVELHPVLSVEFV